MMELSDLGLSATTLVNHLRRAARAQQRYLLTQQKLDVKADPAVEHQLTNHVLLLEMIAKSSGMSDDAIQVEVDLGRSQARSEI